MQRLPDNTVARQQLGIQAICVGLLCLALLLLVGCADSKPKRASDQPDSDSVEALSFNVDQTLLGPRIVDKELGIGLSAPQGWELVDGDLLDQLRANLVDQFSQGLDLELQRLFFDERSQALCAVSKLKSTGLKPEDLRQLEETYRTNFPEAIVKTGTFLKEPFRVQQVMVSTPSLVVIKLLFDAVPPFEVDYVVPKQMYLEALRAIESSIGSISAITDNPKGK